MTALGSAAPVTVTAVAPSTPALAARAKKKSEFLWDVAVLVSKHEPGINGDAQNIYYPPEANEGRAQGIASDPPVCGSLHRSLVDDFEATAGYAPRFSLVAVDHTAFVRTIVPHPNPHDSVIGDSPLGHRWT